MKKIWILLGFLAFFIPLQSQSLLDADSLIVVQENDTTYTVLATTIYKGITANALKAIFKDRFERSNRLKLQSARTALQLEAKAKRDEAKYTEITGDTIVVDSISLDGDWTIRGGEVTLKFTVTNNQSTSNKVKLKIVSIEELVISVDKVGEVTFYRQDEKTWLGKADTLYKMTLDKPKAKNKN